MRTIARFMDARNTAEGKFLSVLLSVLLVFSFLNVTMFTDYANATDEEGEATEFAEPAAEPGDEAQPGGTAGEPEKETKSLTEGEENEGAPEQGQPESEEPSGEVNGTEGKELNTAEKGLGSTMVAALDAAPLTLQEKDSADYGVKAAAPKRTYRVYLYTLLPGVDSPNSSNPNASWNGMGTGSISGVNNPANETVGTELSIGDAQLELPDSYPDITVDGVAYKYAPSDSGNATAKGYYTIEWTRLAVADGANAGNNGVNPTVPNGTNTFHLDGQVFINKDNYWNVAFEIWGAAGQRLRHQDRLFPSREGWHC